MIILLAIFITSVALEFNKCTNCKWFLPKDKNGLCKMFGKLDLKRSFYEFADHCRKNENMCGESGYLFDKREPNDLKMIIKKKIDLEDQLKSLEEVNETDVDRV